MDGIEAKVVECGLYNENGELVMKIDPKSFNNDMVEEMIKTCFCSLNSGLPDEAITYLRECMEENTVGSTVFAEDGDLYLGYLNADNGIIGHTCIMPDIVNVSNPNDKTVFVEFTDGTKEVAHLNDGDVFSLEVGVLICVVKKLLSEMDIIGTGSSAYNKIIKYALGKLDATKKKREEEQKKAKEERAKLASIKQEVRRAENKKREDRIREMTEAYKRAIGEVSKQASAELEESFKGLLDELEKAEKKDE